MGSVMLLEAWKCRLLPVQLGPRYDNRDSPSGGCFMRKAVYAGSFDPIPNGHLWIIRQAADVVRRYVPPRVFAALQAVHGAHHA
jgi:hypothetical protein